MRTPQLPLTDSLVCFVSDGAVDGDVMAEAPCFHDADRRAWSQFIQVMQCRSTKSLCAKCGLVLNSE